MSNNTGVEKNEQNSNTDCNLDHQISLKDKEMLVFQQFSHFSKLAVALKPPLPSGPPSKGFFRLSMSNYGHQSDFNWAFVIGALSNFSKWKIFYWNLISCKLGNEIGLKLLTKPQTTLRFFELQYHQIKLKLDFIILVIF